MSSEVRRHIRSIPLLLGLLAIAFHQGDAKPRRQFPSDAYKYLRQRRQMISRTGVGLLLEPRLEFQNNNPPSQVVANMFQSVTLECEAGGSPPASIYWTKNGVPIHQTTALVIDASEEQLSEDESPPVTGELQLGLSTTKARLDLECVTPQDEGIYRCIAETQFQKIAAETLLTVKDTNELPFEAECSSQKRVYGSPARIYMWTGNRLEMEGNTVRLFCRATGYPEPLVVWFDPEENLVFDSEKYQVTDTGDLIIRHISWHDDMGEYKCVAENQLGADIAETFLYPTLN